ncbi:MAG: hypothetical protein WCO00_08945 [Rhodospirillaceae bacterium]
MNKTFAALALLALAAPFAASAADLPQGAGSRTAPAQERQETGKASTLPAPAAAALPAPEQRLPAAAVKTTDPKAPAPAPAAAAVTGLTGPASQPQMAARPHQTRPGQGQVEGKQDEKVPVVK